MKMFDAKKSDIRILSMDIFQMLGLAGWSEEEKNNYLDRFTRIVFEYYIAVKLLTFIEEEDREKLLEQFANDPIDVEAFFKEIKDLVPGASDLFSEALIETKARVVKDHYVNIQNDLSEKLSLTSDEEEKKEIQKKLQKCIDNVNYVVSGDFGNINYDFSK
jgi:hypothetical protein